MNKDEALGFPPGSIRALLALILVVAIIILAFIEKSENVKMMLIGGLLSAVSSVVALYFMKTKEKGETGELISGTLQTTVKGGPDEKAQ